MMAGGVVNDANVATDRAPVHCAPRPVRVPIPGSAISRSSPPSSGQAASRLLALRSELTSSRPFATAASAIVSRDSGTITRARGSASLTSHRTIRPNGASASVRK